MIAIHLWPDVRVEIQMMADMSRLPKSGIGLDGPHLIIAPPGNPIISLDGRLLDSIDIVGHSPVLPSVLGVSAVLGAAASALALIPGGFVVTAACGYLAHDRLSLAHKRSKEIYLLLGLGGLRVELEVDDGADAAKKLSELIKPYTRSAAITNHEVYEDAKRRLNEHGAQKFSPGQLSRQRALKVGDERVVVEGEQLRVGNKLFRVQEVREFALRGANLPLSGGRFLQAALALLVVEAEKRAVAGEDLEALSRRIAAYEEWTGRRGGQ